jgi:hypothetical protein
MKITGTNEDPVVPELVKAMTPLLEALDDSKLSIHVFGLRQSGRPLVRLLVDPDQPYTERLKEMSGWLKGINIEVITDTDEGVALGLRRDLRKDVETCKGIIAYFACGMGHEVIPPGQDTISNLINKVRRLS